MPATRFSTVTATELQEASAEQLASQCQTGCREAFELLVAQFESRIFNFLCHLVPNRHDAEDLTQDTFLKAYQNIHRYDSAYAFSSWLFTIARRTASNFRRDAKAFEPLEGDEPGDTTDPAVLLETKDESTALWQAARKLKPKQFEALWLRYGEGFSIEETAKIMRMHQIHVRVLLHRGRLHLAKILRHDSRVAYAEAPTNWRMKQLIV